MFTLSSYRLFGIFLLLLLLAAGACKKEYSYEAGNLPVQPPPPPPPPPPPAAKYPFCADCAGRDEYVMGRWSFKIDTTLFCGVVTDAVTSPEREGFTFFGPSQCSGDTGLIMTIFLPGQPLNIDRAGITTQRAALQYYDKTTFIDVFSARTSTGITFFLESYNHAAKTARGKFMGYVYTKTNQLELVKDGKFVITFSN